SPAARLIGYPKLDCLVDGTLNRDDVLRSLGLDPAKRAIMYAPTWSPYSSLNAMGEQLVMLCCAAGYTVIVKLHDRSRDPEYHHSGGIDWAARLGPMLKAHGGHFAEGCDSSVYLAAADAVITDHSSVGFEYCVLDRPLIRIEMPLLFKKLDISPEYVSLLERASTTVQDARQAVAAVERALAEPAQKSAERKSVAEEIFYRPGTATARAVSEMYELLELEPLNSQPAT